MGEIDWMSGILVAMAGIGAGAALALTRRGETADAEGEARVRDLEQQKAEALQALKDLDDVQGVRGIQATAEERRALELRAAAAMRELEQARPTPKPRPSRSSDGPWISPQLQGFVTGAVVVSVAAAILFALQQGTMERTEGMSITGAAPEPAEQRRTPMPGTTGGAVAGVPPSLAPKPSDAVNAARALVAASPESTDAWAALGWALVEAEGWIDVWNAAGELLTLSPGHPDGLTLQAVVRTAMGMTDAAGTLLDDALEADPNHIQALSWKGSLLLRSGDREGAKTVWGKAASLAPDGGFDELVAMADTIDLSRPPGKASGARPSDHPPAPGGPPPAPAVDGATQGGGNRIAGTVSLAAGATPPPGGVVFLIARHPGVTRGPPVATRKLSAASFPVAFDLGDEHVMMGGPFPARVDLTARLDADGNAMTKDESDLHASAGTVEAGASALQLVLN